jgi:hypothetical protein
VADSLLDRMAEQLRCILELPHDTGLKERCEIQYPAELLLAEYDAKGAGGVAVAYIEEFVRPTGAAPRNAIAPDGGEADAWRSFCSALMSAMADIVGLPTIDDCAKKETLDRSAVMQRVMRIRRAWDEYSRFRAVHPTAPAGEGGGS